MARALQLATLGAGHVSPNPMVGAVIVSADGRIIGEGWHRAYGGPHAEVNAFRSIRPADEHLISGATIYVTLEPCSHYGKTPPCARLLVEKGIRRAVIATADPNEKVAGRGTAMLRDNGIEVRENVMREESRMLNRRFITAHTLRRPWIQLKWAESADGFMAAEAHVANGMTPEYPYESAQLSTPVSAALMHAGRALCDAIMAGTNTLLHDKPSLTTRLWPGRSPRPVAFRFDGCDGFLIGGREPLWLDPALPLRDNIERLFTEHGITSLMVEGGATLLKSFLQENLWNEIRRETSSAILGKGLPSPLPAPFRF